MTQLLATKTLEIVLEKEIELPRELRFIECQPAGNRVCLLCGFGSFLYSRYQFDRGFLVVLTVFVGSRFVLAHQLPITKVLLQYDAARAINCINLSHGNIITGKEAGDVQIGMKLRIERLRINRCNSLASLPWNSKIASGGSVRS